MGHTGQGGKRVVGVVGGRLVDEATAPVVPAPDQFRITGEGLGGGQFLGAVTAPE